MTAIIRTTTLDVADMLHAGIRKFDFVPTRLGVQVGNTIRYKVMSYQEEVPHDVNYDCFRVTCVLKDDPRVHNTLSLIGLEKIDFGF